MLAYKNTYYKQTEKLKHHKEPEDITLNVCSYLCCVVMEAEIIHWRRLMNAM